MTQTELKTLKEFQMLTNLEQSFLLAYISREKDAIAAARTIYPKRNTLSLQSFVRYMLTKPVISSLIYRIDGQSIPSPQERMQQLWQLAKISKSDSARVEAIKEINRMEGIGKAENEVDLRELARKLDANAKT